eukprot:FR735711.1.p2 GENE.FR735711.1~~FR735711.1.p2  ORF type:complete len:104 (-),score=6.36 FR735711.1:188-499(-)
MPMTACATWMWYSRPVVVQHNDVIIVDFDDFAAVPLVALVGFPPPLDTTANVRNIVRLAFRSRRVNYSVIIPMIFFVYFPVFWCFFLIFHGKCPNVIPVITRA